MENTNIGRGFLTINYFDAGKLNLCILARFLNVKMNKFLPTYG